MNKKIAGLIVLVMMVFSLHAQEQVLKKGMVIRSSMKIKKATYRLDGFDSLQRAVILVEGNNLVIDFNQAILQGSSNKKNPDAFYGLAILVKNGRNITIKNLKAKGYKVALMALHVEGLKIENCDFSYNYRQHLNSTQEKEDISDWMSYHHNEKDEWLRYGAAMYLRGCNNVIVSNCRVTGGQNALMLTNCNNGIIYNNDFSFNSGIGIGMYQSSNNRILYNKINFNVRGYSHGVYNRGQDSAGILVYEQSNTNLFFKNSVTHGGDGFFLWAGQTTMDTGKGGCNDNQLRENDFSYAPTNGIEVTFSRNQISHNRIFECDHGIWGGYSFETAIVANQFRNNRIAIAIEHGLHNQIENNIFFRDGEAIRLWSRPQQPSDWGYAKYRDTRSAGYRIALNSFNHNPLVYNLTRTDSLEVFSNAYVNCVRLYKMDSTVTNIDTTEKDLMDTTANDPVVKNPMDPFKGAAKLAGRKNILMTEWGPYDFRYPLIWNTNPTDTTGKMEFSVLGPKGRWRIITSKGLEDISVKGDSLPANFSARKAGLGKTDLEIVAEYTGASFTDAFGNLVPAGKPYRFLFKKFFQPIDFTIRFYDIDSTFNPIVSGLPTDARPFKSEQVNKLDYAWWGGINAEGKTHSRFFTIAEGKVQVDPGNYELGVTWDDAVRVYLDGKLILDEWNPSKYQFDESPNKKVMIRLGGEHTFRVEHVELGGFATLALKLTRL